MPKHKAKTEQVRDVTAAEVTKVKSEVENFQQKWGMELTQQETNAMIKELTSQLASSEGEVKIRPAVRNEMFAMLIEKDPEKAISFRMEAYEKRGKAISAEDKAHIKEIAREGGWKAARMELKEMFRPEKVRRKRTETAQATAETAQAPTRKVQAALKRQKKAAVREFRKTAQARAQEKASKTETAQAEDKTQGLTADEMIDAKIKMYDSANAQIRTAEESCERKEEAIKARYLEEFSMQNPDDAEILKGTVEASAHQSEIAIERFNNFLEANQEYRKEMDAAEKEMHSRIAKPKADRDRLGGEVYAAIQKEYLNKTATELEIAAVEKEGQWSAMGGMQYYYKDSKQMRPAEVKVNAIHMDTLMRGMEGRWKAMQAKKKRI